MIIAKYTDVAKGRVSVPISDIRFADACALCEEPLREGRHLCEPCRSSLPRIESPFCMHCGSSIDGVLPDDLLCPGCRARPFSFTFARAALPAERAAEVVVAEHRREGLLADEPLPIVHPAAGVQREERPQLVRRRAKKPVRLDRQVVETVAEE